LERDAQEISSLKATLEQAEVAQKNRDVAQVNHFKQALLQDMKREIAQSKLKLKQANRELANSRQEVRSDNREIRRNRCTSASTPQRE